MLKTAGFMVYGYNHFTESGYASAAKNFTENINFNDCQGKSFVVTGANSGLGKSTTIFLSRLKGTTVHMVCRDAERGQIAFQEIKDLTGSDKLFLHICDMSEQKQIRLFADKFIAEFGKLDVLVNNAGVMLKQQQFTSEGIDAVLATNTISNFLLTNLMVPLLEKSEDPRVIMVSSAGAFLEKLALWTDYTQAIYNAEMNYAKTKRHQISLCEQYAKVFPKIGFYSVHPGWSDTPGVEASMPEFYAMMKGKLRSVEHGADTINWLCVSNIDKTKYSGGFFRDRQEEIKHLPLADTQQYNTNGHLRSLWCWLSSITNSGTLGVELNDIREIVEDMKTKVKITKHSNSLFALSKEDCFKGTEIINQLSHSENLEHRMLICQMILDAGFIFDVFSKHVVPYVIFQQENYYIWGLVPSDNELIELISDEWVHKYVDDIDNLEGWKVERESHKYKVYQKGHGLKPTLVQYKSKATIDQLLLVLDTYFLEKHKEWNSSFDYGVHFRKLTDNITIEYLRYSPHLIDSRDFVCLRKVMQLKDERIVIAERSIEHGRFPDSDSIRCDIIYQIRIFKKENDHTFIVSANLTDVKGLIPISVVNNSNVEVVIEEITKASKAALH